jgi:hypothetical protein
VGVETSEVSSYLVENARVIEEIKVIATIETSSLEAFVRVERKVIYSKIASEDSNTCALY